MESEIDVEEIEVQTTPLAREVNRLKEAAKNIVESRERVPHPLFWSAFQLQVEEIKKLKERDRIRRNNLYYGDNSPEQKPDPK